MIRKQRTSDLDLSKGQQQPNPFLIGEKRGGEIILARPTGMGVAHKTLDSIVVVIDSMTERDDR